MKKLLAVASLFLIGSTAHAAMIDAPIPDDLYITIDGMDWAWAGPCSPVEPSCGTADMSFQSGEGWRLPDAADFANAPSAADFLRDDGSLRCAAAYFSNTYDHCDYSDGENGYVYNMPGGQDPNTNEEFWAVRGAAVDTPEPGSLALLGVGLLGMGLRRRKIV